MTDQTRIIDKIKKCLALSKSSNEHEAAAALSQAQKLMAMHNLTEETVEVGAIEADTVTSMTTVSKVKMWENILATGICKALAIELLWNAGIGRNFGRFIFIGPKSDVEVAKFLWTTLSRKTYQARAQYLKGVSYRADKSELGDSFAAGYAITVVSKVEAFVRPVAHQALILAKKEQLSTGGQAKEQKKDLNGAALAAGKQAGQDVQLRHGMHGTNTAQRAALGETKMLPA